MKLHLVLLTLAGSSVLTASANAAVVLSDDFDDPDDTLVNGKSADVGGPWSENTGVLAVNGGVVDTTGAGRTAFADFTAALGAGQTLTLTFDAAESAGTMFGDGFAGVSLFVDDGERLFIGDLGVDTFWGVDETGVGTLSTTNTDEDNTATFTYVYDTGDWALSLSSGENINGVAAAGIAANRLRFANGNGGDLAIDSLEVSIVPEPGSIALLGLGGLAMMRRRR